MRYRTNALINEDVTLRYRFNKNSAAYDIYQWVKVEIYNVDPRDNPGAVPIQTILPADITRESVGLYSYVMTAVATSGVYWDKQYYYPDPSVGELTDVETVLVNELTPPSPTPPCLTKTGYCFDNYTVPVDQWGVVLTPDDMRHQWLFGIDLVATNGNEVQDVQLAFAVDAATRAMERYLGIDIYRKIYKTNPADSLVQAKKWRNGVDYTDEEEVYPFRPEAWKNYGFIQLRHFPVIRVTRCDLYSITHSKLFDGIANKWMRIEKEAGQVYLFPTNFSYPYGPPGLASMGGGWLWLQQTNSQYPGGFEIDYETGYKSSDWVPQDLREIIGKVAAIHLLNWVGDGLLAGFSSSSVGIDGLSEAFSSTQSATSAYFGARILQYVNELKKDLPAIRFKFSNIPVAFI